MLKDTSSFKTDLAQKTESPGKTFFKYVDVGDGDAWECQNCKNLWVFEFGGPTENNYNYCPNCGYKATF